MGHHLNVPPHEELASTCPPFPLEYWPTLRRACRDQAGKGERSGSRPPGRGWGPRLESHYLRIEGLWQTQIPGRGAPGNP